MSGTEPIQIVGRSSSRAGFSPQISATKEDVRVSNSPVRVDRTSQMAVVENSPSGAVIIRSGSFQSMKTSLVHTSQVVVTESANLTEVRQSVPMVVAGTEDPRNGTWVRFDEQSLSNVAGLIIQQFDKNRSGMLEDAEISEMLAAGRQNTASRVTTLDRDEIGTALAVHDADRDGKYTLRDQTRPQ